MYYFTISSISPQDPSSPLISTVQKLRRQRLSVVIWRDIGDWIRERLQSPIIPWPEWSQSEALHTSGSFLADGTRFERAFVFDTDCLLNPSTSLDDDYTRWTLFIQSQSRQYFSSRRMDEKNFNQKYTRSFHSGSLRWNVNMRTDRTDPYRYDCRASTLRFHTNNILI